MTCSPFSELHCQSNISGSVQAIQEYEAAESLLFAWSPNFHDQILITPHTYCVSLEYYHFFVVNLQIHGQLLVKVLTLSRYWTCLHMAMKFLSHCEFQCRCQFCYLFSGLQCPYSYLIFCCYKLSSSVSIIFELENTECQDFKFLINITAYILRKKPK